MPGLFDIVKLIKASGDLPAGVEGAVVDVHDDGTLTVEVTDAPDDAALLDSLIDVPASNVRIVARSAQPA